VDGVYDVMGVMSHVTKLDVILWRNCDFFKI
jgi:hypothetical protein